MNLCDDYLQAWCWWVADGGGQQELWQDFVANPL